jgi:hypothetical protein
MRRGNSDLFTPLVFSEGSKKRKKTNANMGGIGWMGSIYGG